MLCQCFWSSPPTASDSLVRGWDQLADLWIGYNLLWQRGEQGDDHEPVRSHQRCARSESGPPEMMLAVAARQTGISLEPLHGLSITAGWPDDRKDFVRRSAACSLFATWRAPKRELLAVQTPKLCPLTLHLNV